jgi:thymidylate synthase
VIKALQEDPTDRRLVVSAWNPADIPLMALPPCHILYQFYVDVDDNTLSCQMYQRSCDVGLGLPFNIASYALLTHIVAHICGYKPGRLIMCLGDTHIYINHVEAIKSQTSRSVSSALPILKLSPDCPKDLDLIREEHIILENYDPQPAVLMLMSV